MTLLAAIDLRQYYIINYANAKACDITSFNWTAFIPYLIAMKTGSEVCELLSTQLLGPNNNEINHLGTFGKSNVRFRGIERTCTCSSSHLFLEQDYVLRHEFFGIVNIS